MLIVLSSEVTRQQSNRHAAIHPLRIAQRLILTFWQGISHLIQAGFPLKGMVQVNRSDAVADIFRCQAQ